MKQNAGAGEQKFVTKLTISSVLVFQPFRIQSTEAGDVYLRIEEGLDLMLLCQQTETKQISIL